MSVPEFFPDLPEILAAMGDEEEVATPDTSGWSDLGGQARKFHFFPSNEPGTRALCGKWMLSPFVANHAHLQLDEGMANSGDCAACARKIVR
jgi:hypothetical protein